MYTTTTNATIVESAEATSAGGRTIGVNLYRQGANWGVGWADEDHAGFITTSEASARETFSQRLKDWRASSAA